LVVQVHLHTSLRRRTPGGIVRQLAAELPDGATLGGLLGVLDIKPKGLLLVVNGRTAEPSLVLEEGDEVHLIPALSGG